MWLAFSMLAGTHSWDLPLDAWVAEADLIFDGTARCGADRALDEDDRPAVNRCVLTPGAVYKGVLAAPIEVTPTGPGFVYTRGEPDALARFPWRDGKRYLVFAVVSDGRVSLVADSDMGSSVLYEGSSPDGEAVALVGPGAQLACARQGKGLRAVDRDAVESGAIAADLIGLDAVVGFVTSRTHR